MSNARKRRTTEEEGDLRLVDGSADNDGRLEIYHDGSWGTICDDGFSVVDASVACVQMGYADGATASYTAGGGTLNILLDDLACTGTETMLSDCSHSGWGNHNCAHSEVCRRFARGC